MSSFVGNLETKRKSIYSEDALAAIRAAAESVIPKGTESRRRIMQQIDLVLNEGDPMGGMTGLRAAASVSTDQAYQRAVEVAWHATKGAFNELTKNSPIYE